MVNDKTIEGIMATTFIGETTGARIDNMVNDKTIIEGITMTTFIGETTDNMVNDKTIIEEITITTSIGETTEKHRTEAYGNQRVRTTTYVTNLWRTDCR